MEAQRAVKTIGLICLCIIFTGSGVLLFFNLGSLLIVSNQPPDTLDVLYTLSGENTRIVYAKTLYDHYPNALRIISCPPEMKSDSAFQQWVHRNKIETVDTCGNTRSEISFLINSLSRIQSANSKKIISVGIISNWYHMRRVQLIVNTQMKHPKCRVFYLCVPSQIDPYRSGAATWWKQQLYRHIVFSELEKIVLYWLQHVV
ncbi:MAG TPA: hypothetical protein VF335_02350 [Chitinivibrionales bacterium]